VRRPYRAFGASAVRFHVPGSASLMGLAVPSRSVERRLPIDRRRCPVNREFAGRWPSLHASLMVAGCPTHLRGPRARAHRLTAMMRTSMPSLPFRAEASRPGRSYPTISPGIRPRRMATWPLCAPSPLHRHHRERPLLRDVARLASVDEVPPSPIPFRPRGFAPPRRVPPLTARGLVASRCRS
jgi:hypothetical protein